MDSSTTTTRHDLYHHLVFKSLTLTQPCLLHSVCVCVVVVDRRRTTTTYCTVASESCVLFCLVSFRFLPFDQISFFFDLLFPLQLFPRFHTILAFVLVGGGGGGGGGGGVGLCLGWFHCSLFIPKVCANNERCTLYASVRKFRCGMCVAWPDRMSASVS